MPGRILTAGGLLGVLLAAVSFLADLAGLGVPLSIRPLFGSWVPSPDSTLLSLGVVTALSPGTLEIVNKDTGSKLILELETLSTHTVRVPPGAYEVTFIEKPTPLTLTPAAAVTPEGPMVFIPPPTVMVHLTSSMKDPLLLVSGSVVQLTYKSGP